MMLKKMMIVFLVGSMLRAEAVENCFWAGAGASGLIAAVSTAAMVESKSFPQYYWYGPTPLSTIASISSFLCIGLGVVTMGLQAKSVLNTYLDSNMHARRKKKAYVHCLQKVTIGALASMLGVACLKLIGPAYDQIGFRNKYILRAQ